MTEMCPCINKNARPDNNQLITYYQHVSYLVNNTTIPCEIILTIVYISLFMLDRLESTRRTTNPESTPPSNAIKHGS